MTTTFNVFYLGTVPGLDPVEGNNTAENAASILGTTFGSPGGPLYNQIQTLSPGNYNSDAVDGYDTDNSIANDTFRIDGGALQTMDTVVNYNATITYLDGTTATITAVVFQDTDGNLYLAPELTYNTDQAALEAQPITSLTLDSVASDAYLEADRNAADFATVVDGTTGDDSMGQGYTDAQGDQITTGDDVIDGGAGNDTIDASTGNDTLIGGAGNDRLSGNAGNDVFDLRGGGTDFVNGGDGYDILDASGITTESFSVSFFNIEEIHASDGGDSWYWNGSTESILFYGGAGDDSVYAGAGNDTLYGGDGSDTFTFENNFGSDTIIGGTGGADYDTLNFTYITTALTVTYTGDGAGTITDGTNTVTFSEIERLNLSNQADSADASADTAGTEISAGAGNDTITGGTGNDTLWGGNDDDLVSGGDGDDILLGDSGNDTVHGDAGDDSLWGGAGNDFLTGGAGDDIFYYSIGGDADTITDFNTGNTGTLLDGDSTNNDFIDLSNYYDTLWELHADQADDGILNQSNDGVDGVDYSDNNQFGTGSLTFTGATADNSFFTTENTGVTCYLAGTRILTPTGEVNIEHLRAGDLVTTSDHGAQTIRWIGVSEVNATPAIAPVHIAKGALGAGLPRRDLFVSPQHRMVARSRIVARMTGEKEALVAANKLTALPGISVSGAAGRLCYYHLICDAHEIIFAEGAPSETLLPGPQARAMMAPAAWKELITIFPELACGKHCPPPIRPILPTTRSKRLIERHSHNAKPLFSVAVNGSAKREKTLGIGRNQMKAW